ncbi:MAG TPA: PAS domain S-box protein [Rhizorhapis sp.]
MDASTDETQKAGGILQAMNGSSAVLEHMPIGVYCCDHQGIVRQFNRRTVEILGSQPRIGETHEQFCSRMRLFHPDGQLMQPQETPSAEALAKAAPVRDRRVLIERPDGRRITILINIDPLFDQDGEFTGIVSCFQDISIFSRVYEALKRRTTDLKGAKKKWRDGEQHFRDVLEALPAAIYTTDADGVITYYNAAAVELSGREPTLGHDKWCTTWRLHSTNGAPLPHDECPMAVALKEQRPVTGEEAIAERPDGSRVRFAAYPTPLFDAEGQLSGAVNMLLDVSARHTAEIQAAHLAAVVASSTDAIISKSLNGIVQSWNAGAEQIFGYKAEEMIGQPIIRIIPAELRQEEEEILSKLRRGERIEHFETIRLGKNGERIDISLTVSPVHDKTGKVIGASKVARDIRERKRAEELQQLLIGELNHRIKNTLATVQSIANQMARTHVRPKDFAVSFAGRIGSLAQAHGLLTQSSWQSADIMPLVRDQILLGGDEDDRISCSGPSVALEPQAALHLALVLHELGTNARKYGALSVPGGRLAVSWEVHSIGGFQLHLRWRESGGPPVSAPQERGFGTTLVEKSLAADGGKASIRYQATGLACDISLPLAGRVSLRDASPMQNRNTDGHTLSAKPTASAAPQRRARILLIEDEPLIAMDMCDTLEDAGYTVVGPASTLDEAHELVETAKFDAALLDANLSGEAVDEVAAALTRKGMPFAFVTGYGREALPEAFRHAPLLNKPLLPKSAFDMLEKLLSRETPHIGPTAAKDENLTSKLRQS